MRVLVLGGTGAMGVDLVKLLAERGNNVTVTSRSSHRSEFENVKYVYGNAHDTAFLKTLLNEKYDAIVDFMHYTTEEFKSRRDIFLDSAAQHIFLSSSRVYADSKAPITEDSPRLLDAIKDEIYLQTDEYALAKARQENLLRESGKTNWTIVRPYITYSNQRLQLGIFEKELWLYRALQGQTIVFPKDIAGHTTTLTWGKNVAWGIAALVGNLEAYGKAFHITTSASIRWDEVLELYQRVFHEVTGKPMKIKFIDTSEKIEKMKYHQYQLRYDRLFDRRFDNREITNLARDIDFVSPKDGLEMCLREFLEKPRFRHVPSSIMLAWMDRQTGEWTKLAELPTLKRKIKYVFCRYAPESFLPCSKAVKE